jgi:phage tail tape-measure protein
MPGRTSHHPVRLAAAVLAVAIFAAPAAAQQTCEVSPFRGMTQPGGAQATMRVVNTGEPCRIRYLMRTEPQRVPFEQAQISRAPANGTATATGDGAAYTPRPGFAGTDTFTVTTRGAWQGHIVNGQIAVTVTVLPRP